MFQPGWHNPSLSRQSGRSIECVLSGLLTGNPPLAVVGLGGDIDLQIDNTVPILWALLSDHL
jgi:hypothetical protein